MFLELVVELEFIVRLVNLVFPFLIHKECKSITEGYNYKSLTMASRLTPISLSAHMFLYCFYPWSYILYAQPSSCKNADFFLKNMPSIRAKFSHVFEMFQGFFLAFLL